MGNPWVRFSHTIPVPWNTVPMAGTTHTQPETHVVFYETRSIFPTCSILIIKIIKITTIITIAIVYNGHEGEDTTRWLLPLVATHIC